MRAGNLSKSLVLVNDAVKGFQGSGESVESEWVPPDRPGTYNIWAVLRDQRGGASIQRRVVQVQDEPCP